MNRLPAARTRRYGADAGALVAGAAGVLAFAPFGWWPMAVLSPAALFALWRGCTRGRAAWRGWLFGVGYWGAGVYWIYFSLHLFGAAIAPLSALLTAIFVAGLALTLALLGAVIAVGEPNRRSVAWFLLVLPGGWVLLEWFRSWFLTGFPWLLLGTSQIESPLAGFAPLAGVYGVSLVVAFTAGALAGLLWFKARASILALFAVMVLWVGGALLQTVQWTRPAGPSIDVALIQGNIPPERKFDTLHIAIERYTDMTRRVAGSAEIVVWPETAMPTFYSRVAGLLNAFARQMAAKGTHVVTGVFTHGEGRRYHNAVRELGRGEDEQYRKSHLVPFGEYLPLRGLLAPFERFIDIPMSDIAPGAADQGTLHVGPELDSGQGGWEIGVSVCYEAAYPGIVRSALPGAEILVNVSNDAWFGDSTAPFQHLELARMRALELGRPMLRATNTGISAVIDYRGQIRVHGPLFEPAIVRGEVTPRAGLTPFAAWGSTPVLVLALLMLVVSIATGWPSPQPLSRRVSRKG